MCLYSCMVYLHRMRSQTIRAYEWLNDKTIEVFDTNLEVLKKYGVYPTICDVLSIGKGDYSFTVFGEDRITVILGIGFVEV